MEDGLQGQVKGAGRLHKFRRNELSRALREKPWLRKKLKIQQGKKNGQLEK